jgi:Zn-dependent protease
MDLGLTQAELRAGLIFFLLLFSCLILRAFAQAFVADRLGDPTPANDGRLTLYPVPHVDLLGTVILPLLCIFYLQPRIGPVNFFLAWTKPVPTNPSNFAHPGRHSLFVALAGFGMSLILALSAAILGGLLFRVEPRTLEIIQGLIGINAMLIVLDLLPVPPLPGGMILRQIGVISEETFWSLSRWTGIALLIAFNIPPVQRLIGLLVALVAYPFVMIFRAIAQ